MKKLFIIFILASIVLGPLYSQDDPELAKYLKRREGIKYPNILKVNTLAIPFNNISMSYERGVVPRFSILIAAGYKYSGNLPDLFGAENENLQIKLDQITGYSLSPELRYYLK